MRLMPSSSSAPRVHPRRTLTATAKHHKLARNLSSTFCPILKQISVQQRRSNIRLVCGEYMADVISDGGSRRPVYHWVVQRQVQTLAEAEDIATAVISDLARKRTKSKGTAA